jgi:predicted lipoprotein with Yx(FWY)xxD motif
VPGLKRYSKLTLTLVIAVSAGFAVAGIVSAAVVRTFTVQVAPNATVTDTAGKTTTESIVVNGRGRALYELRGDSKRHPECTQVVGCFRFAHGVASGFWPPLIVASARDLRKATGVRGKLGTWRRNGFLQVTLNGHFLYRFANDSRARAATGEGIQSFGGTGHVVRGPASAPSSGTPTTPSTSSSTTTSSTTPCLYPPC